MTDAAGPPDKLAVRLEGRLVALEPLCEAHREDLWRAAGDEDIFQWTTHIADSRDDFDAWMTGRLSPRDGIYTFATIDRASATPIGSTSFHDYRPWDGVVEIGSTWLAPSFWRTGANCEAKLLMLSHAFAELGCVRVQFKTDAGNRRSRAALAALPAQFEGVLRKQIRIHGVGVRDSALYSVIDDEWPAVRANLEARVARHLQHR